MTSIFLSHNHNDKPVVEPIALRLAEIFGKDNVFYDSWSIQPGDGIIERMNHGLQSPDYVFYFASKNSLESKMVEMEWQNALFKATRGECRVIPVRVDNSKMPAVLTQSLYIDLYSNGLEVAISQIVNVSQGNSSFTPQHEGFSNLTWTVDVSEGESTTIVIQASHFLEANPRFCILAQNAHDEINISLPDHGMFQSGFDEIIRLNDGTTSPSFNIGLIGTITPTIPLRIKIKTQKGAKLRLRAILHQKGLNDFRSIPQQA